MMKLSSNRKAALKSGGYSVLAGIILLAILVVVNLIAVKLPSSITEIDLTQNKMLTLSAESERIITDLDEDITLYWVVQTGAEDEYLKVLLERYESLSKHIKVEKKDPDVYPTFVNKYYQGGVYNNSVAVVGEELHRYINYSDIYTYDYSQYESTGKINTMFSGESAITGAINYISSGIVNTLYELNGHGESALSDDFCRSLNNSNIHIETLSIITQGEIPADCSVLLINSPVSDLSEYEDSIIKDYIKGGGNVVYISNPPVDGVELQRFESITADYGVTAEKGIVIEETDENYLLGTPYYLLPHMEESEITKNLISGKYHILMPIAQGLVIDEKTDNVTSILTTSNKSYSKITGYEAENFQREENDISGPFALAVDIKADSGRIIRFSSAGIVDDGVNQRVAGANANIFVNSINSTLGGETRLSIVPHTVKNEYLTIDSASKNRITAVIYAIPALLAAVGTSVVTIRKRK